MTDDIASMTPEDRSEARKKWITRLVAAIAIAAAIVAIWYFVTQRGRVSTDNAYVGADTAQITSLIAGPIKQVNVANTQNVRKGDILVVLDDTDAQVELASARAALLKAQQKFGQARATEGALGARVDAQSAQARQAQAMVDAAQADYSKARDAFDRRNALSGSGAVSAEELATARSELAQRAAVLQQARAALISARASRASARGDLSVNEVITRSTTEESNPDIASARAQLMAAEVNVARTIIRAPVSGVISQKSVQIGQRVAAGTPLMTIVPMDTVYIDANFKESQLRSVRIGQKAVVTSDYYGSGVEYTGTVTGIAGGTGAAFALIPSQNATGNWVKVIQRLPVRITLDKKLLKDHPLRVGLSADVIVDTR